MENKEFKHNGLSFERVLVRFRAFTRYSVGCFALLVWAGAAHAAPLSVVNVGFPDINCKFDADCTITVTDTTDHFMLPGTAGDAFLQSRTWPVGEAGTAGAGLYAYLYRLDLTHLAGILDQPPCINRLVMDFGAVSPLDYNNDGASDQVFVGTSGGLGSIGLTSVDKTGSTITFNFAPTVCTGSAPGAGNGQTSYFFGLASTRAARNITAQILNTQGDSISLDARAPSPFFVFLPPWLIAILLLLLAGITVFLVMRRVRR